MKRIIWIGKKWKICINGSEYTYRVAERYRNGMYKIQVTYKRFNSIKEKPLMITYNSYYHLRKLYNRHLEGGLIEC